MLRLRAAASRRGLGVTEADQASPAAGVATVVPETIEEAADFLADATDRGTRVLVLGGGTHQGLGYELEPDVVLSTAHLNRLVAWEPDDLTAVVEGGITVADFEGRLREAGQTAVLPEHPGPGTVGGVIAAGRSAWRRYRYGPTRDRVLETTLVTGDGRVVTAGGRLVKNVTGYDIPRLAVGSLGSLGLIARVCFKLWPIPNALATAEVESAERAQAVAYRPQAILETHERTTVYLAGTHEEVAGQAAELGATTVSGHHWPDMATGAVQFSIRVPPSRLRETLNLVEVGWQYVAQFGVGEVSVGARSIEVNQLAELRAFSEAAGGSLVLRSASGDLRTHIDPWGTPPTTLTLQRRVVAQFDPARILNPGRLPGRV